MTHTGQMTGSYYGYDGDYSQGDWYNWAYYASVEALTLSENKHSESFDIMSEDGQTDQNNRFCFFLAICLFRNLGHELVEAMTFVLLFASLLCQCFSDLSRYSIKSIHFVEESIATDTGDMHLCLHSTHAHSNPKSRKSVYI